MRLSLLVGIFGIIYNSVDGRLIEFILKIEYFESDVFLTYSIIGIFRLADSVAIGF